MKSGTQARQKVSVADGAKRQLSPLERDEIYLERGRLEMQLENQDQALRKREDQLERTLSAEQAAKSLLDLTIGESGLRRPSYPSAGSARAGDSKEG